MVAWIAALVLSGLVFGLVAQAAGTAIRGAAGLEDAIERLGGSPNGPAAYLGLVFVVAAGLVATAVSGQIAAMRNEEASGHLENLLVRPVARRSWLGVRLAVALGLAIVASVLAGVAAWVGAATQSAGIGLGDLLKAGVNVIPPGVLVLGLGALAFGLLPRAAIATTYGIVVWSFAVETLSAVFTSALAAGHVGAPPRRAGARRAGERRRRTVAHRARAPRSRPRGRRVLAPRHRRRLTLARPSAPQGFDVPSDRALVRV